jgi:hypothetical protein
VETRINEETLETLVNEVEAFVPTAPEGYMMRTIKERGFYEEQGLRFTHEDLPLGHLYAGLAVLARDMHQYLAKHPRDDAALFEEVVSSVNTEEERQYGPQAFPNYAGLPVDNLPEQLASAAADGQPTVAPLGERGIVHEWTFKPGKRLLAKFGSKFKETICGKDGPYEQFNEGLLGQAALPTTIAGTILVAGFSPATFWYPLAVYVSILLVKTVLKTYCEPENSHRESRKTTANSERIETTRS